MAPDPASAPIKEFKNVGPDAARVQQSHDDRLAIFAREDGNADFNINVALPNGEPSVLGCLGYVELHLRKHFNTIKHSCVTGFVQRGDLLEEAV